MFFFQVGGSVSMSAGYAGASAEFSVDVSKFEESEENSKDFGEEPNFPIRLVDMIFRNQFSWSLWALKKH